MGNVAQTICFDLDGTLCTNTWGAYETAEPFPWAIERVNELAAAGHRIVVFTARGTATGIDWSEVTRGQLDSWGVAYDDLRFGKPSAAVYVDDRAVHTTAWRRGDAWSVPGFDAASPQAAPEELPAAAAPQTPSVVEIGRTFAGRTVDLDRHIERARFRARAGGIAAVPSALELRERVEAALDRVSVRPGDDLVWILSVWDAAHAAYLDVWEGGAVPAGIHVACRPLSEVAVGLHRLLVGDGAGEQPAVNVSAGTLGAANGRWPLVADAQGRIRDRLGGSLVIVAGGALVLQAPGATPCVEVRRLLDLAPLWDLAMDPLPLDAGGIERADEAFLVGAPFCLIPIADFDGRPLPGGAPGPVTRALMGAWAASVGVDVGAQVAMLVHGLVEHGARR